MCHSLGATLKAEDSFPVWYRLVFFSTLLYLVPFALFSHVFLLEPTLFSVGRQSLWSVSTGPSVTVEEYTNTTVAYGINYRCFLAAGSGTPHDLTYACLSPLNDIDGAWTRRNDLYLANWRSYASLDTWQSIVFPAGVVQVVIYLAMTVCWMVALCRTRYQRWSDWRGELQHVKQTRRNAYWGARMTLLCGTFMCIGYTGVAATLWDAYRNLHAITYPPTADLRADIQLMSSTEARVAEPRIIAELIAMLGLAWTAWTVQALLGCWWAAQMRKRKRAGLMRAVVEAEEGVNETGHNATEGRAQAAVLGAPLL